METLKRIVSQLDYKRCRDGCDTQVDGYFVSVDKLRRSIVIRDSRNDYIAPPTHLGIVNNHAVDLRAASDGYRAANINGNTWVGLPSQSFGYTYQQSNFGRSHQAEVRWNYRPNGLWATFALGVQKGGFQRDRKGYGVYLNMTMTLEKVQASFGAAHSGGQTQLNADVRKDFQDGFGTSTIGMNANRVGNDFGANVYGSRSGTRGDASLNIGHAAGITNVDFNYRGMAAANRHGAALGRYSGSGSAMLLKTPDIEGTKYGFNVEGNPVAGNGTYAVPLPAYQDVPFARVFSNSQDLDMNIEVPANVVRAHPGQLYSASARVDISMIYSGFLTDAEGKPLSGTIEESGDTVHKNGLFSLVSKKLMSRLTVNRDGKRYHCNLNGAQGSYYRCE
ncbi:fimbria/pilus outer membrane usher protein [Burkholderia sp. 22PA0106]|uniref:fimbria/pilus outer membrane usher protein n=1 Tax=Burkholderia sp. 22PA0106 TaxID=3237371 RepID=UPI0039C4CAC2